ncbi:acyl-CoA acyltransferase [Bradyrhizobium sp. CCBAU 51627]|uniref:acyl-CoA acyltransferase n=1 Tax=Bradyrhizobium sp. CCBAU 51627 TaxID=1325088 RepID=UPI002306B50C|nr:acyl-CoA acyltransferase [Bradyrhizobium sp. CCBAU 51627]MDA9435452.1 acyl-CoA acyltransferase [Bradyrhizobium sp. CCBAU 51627]
MIRCREIAIADLDAIADLLARGFPIRSRDYWIDGLRRLAVREIPDSFPRFGYMLEHDRMPVGALLLIHTTRNDDGRTSIRCNLSSWYVEPAFRSFAPMLTKVAQRHEDVTYVNISPAQWTWRTIEAQGFRRYCGGLFFSLPAMSRPAKAMRVEVVGQDAQGLGGLPEADAALLARHAAYGCLSLVCRAADGRAFPFVLQPMRVARMRLPAMQMIYCPDVADYIVCAGAIGRFLLWRGRLSIALDANGPVRGLVGFYREPIGCKYFKGPHCPRLADLSDSELVIYGP